MGVAWLARPANFTAAEPSTIDVTNLGDFVCRAHVETFPELVRKSFILRLEVGAGILPCNQAFVMQGIRFHSPTHTRAAVNADEEFIVVFSEPLRGLR
jgi:hypothetical protein